ncbi:hypothetical protein E2C01_024836 [Portunus trituberculatus]|uniref:Uncharacterized protein n=1 Tax=Portunus trituberculatus TaxID=210409 RepID=A0A5B7EEX6_PORTR|nr:hypothetical protein [Portunus trituberculatus]
MQDQTQTSSVRKPHCIVQADRFLNTPAPLVDNTCTTPPVQNNNSISSSSSSLTQLTTKTPCNVA